MTLHLAIAAAVLLACTADLWTTHRVLAAGGRELNPLLRWFLLRWGFAALSAAKMAINAACVWLAFWADRPLLALILVPISFGAAWHNWRWLMNTGAKG